MIARGAAPRVPDNDERRKGWARTHGRKKMKKKKKKKECGGMRGNMQEMDSGVVTGRREQSERVGGREREGERSGEGARAVIQPPGRRRRPGMLFRMSHGREVGWRGAEGRGETRGRMRERASEGGMQREKEEWEWGGRCEHACVACGRVRTPVAPTAVRPSRPGSPLPS